MSSKFRTSILNIRLSAVSLPINPLYRRMPRICDWHYQRYLRGARYLDVILQKSQRWWVSRQPHSAHRVTSEQLTELGEAIKQERGGKMLNLYTILLPTKDLCYTKYQEVALSVAAWEKKESLVVLSMSDFKEKASSLFLLFSALFYFLKLLLFILLRRTIKLRIL